MLNSSIDIMKSQIRLMTPIEMVGSQDVQPESRRWWLTLLRYSAQIHFVISLIVHFLHIFRDERLDDSDLLWEFVEWHERSEERWSTLTKHRYNPFVKTTTEFFTFYQVESETSWSGGLLEFLG
ncbi:hypothetical protein GCK72_011789 [Caenorhabditis remanei]|uniref:Uncharacterized protein n=1 Tax=Caenorhabditis remanei TaxID=31234 RepID=A0A6A5HAR4_CAERE|nr:hypothetical protein GCK72_011789 [Caenorhabditis remanei]KAF1763523.1 hypothetical protein GCK72_011789 [Caenorhabditis remanei]